MTIEFITYQPATKVNPYAETITALHEASKTNPGAAVVVTVDADKASTERLKVGQAANDVNRTAKKVAEQTVKGTKGEPDQTSMTFILVPRHKARRGGKTTTE